MSDKKSLNLSNKKFLVFSLSLPLFFVSFLSQSAELISQNIQNKYSTLESLRHTLWISYEKENDRVVDGILYIDENGKTQWLVDVPNSHHLPLYYLFGSHGQGDHHGDINLCINAAWSRKINNDLFYPHLNKLKDELNLINFKTEKNSEDIKRVEELKKEIEEFELIVAAAKNIATGKSKDYLDKDYEKNMRLIQHGHEIFHKLYRNKQGPKPISIRDVDTSSVIYNLLKFPEINDKYYNIGVIGEVAGLIDSTVNNASQVMEYLFQVKQSTFTIMPQYMNGVVTQRKEVHPIKSEDHQSEKVDYITTTKIKSRYDGRLEHALLIDEKDPRTQSITETVDEFYDRLYYRVTFEEGLMTRKQWEEEQAKKRK